MRNQPVRGEECKHDFRGESDGSQPKDAMTDDSDEATTEDSNDCKRSRTLVSRSSDIFNTAVSMAGAMYQRQAQVQRKKLRELGAMSSTTDAGAAHTVCAAGAGAMHSSTSARAAYPFGAGEIYSPKGAGAVHPTGAREMCSRTGAGTVYNAGASAMYSSTCAGATQHTAGAGAMLFTTDAGAVYLTGAGGMYPTTGAGAARPLAQEQHKTLRGPGAVYSTTGVGVT